MKKIKPKYKKLLLDFDGVLFDSNKFKENAIKEATQVFKNKIETDEFCKYFTENNGLSRKDKIFFFFGNNDISHKILEEYNSIVFKQYEYCNLTKGAKEFLIHINQNGYIPYIISGGDKKEIFKCIKKNLYDCKFQDIYDQLKTKQFWIEIIKKQYKLEGYEILFIGDSKVDEQAAKHNGIEFIYMKKYSQNKKYFNNKNQKTIETLSELIQSDLLFIIK